MRMVSSVFSNIPPLFSHLADIVSGDIDCSQLSLKAHSTDGSPYQVRPQAVLYPKTTSDIKHAISFAKEYSIPLTVCGGITAASGGALGEGVIIDMTRYFSHIRHVNMMEHTVTVDAGVSIDDLRNRLAAWNLEIPVLQEEDSRATIGGLVATKSATRGSFYAGTIREWIEGMTIVVDSGEEHTIKDGTTPSGRLLGIYQSVFPLLSEHEPTLRAARREPSDDATGYALWSTSIGPRQLLDQLVGSEGTLAIITSITFRVIARKPRSAHVLVPITNLSVMESAVAIGKRHHVEGMFMFDYTFKNMVDMFHPLLLRPELPETPYYLTLSIRDTNEEAVSKKIRALIKALPFPYPEEFLLPEKTLAKLSAHTFLHSLFDAYTKGAHMVATSGEGLIVPIHSYAECVQALDESLLKSGLLYTLTGFAGSGHIALTASFDAKSETFEKDLQEFRERITSIVTGFKGGISAVGGDGLEKTASLSLVFNEATRDVFKKLKQAWDPQAIFNPGKKLAIAKEFLISHAIRTFL